MRHLWVVAVLACCSGPAPVAKRPIAPPMTAPAPTPIAAAPAGRPTVELAKSELSTFTSTAATGGPAAVTAGAVTTLSESETTALLARLEPLPDLSMHPAPVMRAPSLAPASQGPISPLAFYAPNGATVADKPAAHAPAAIPPLSQPQILPTGEVPAESEIRVRFDEAMIAVAQIDSAPAPAVTIMPAVTGTWRWLDTHVAVFTAGGKRLPQATQFTVTVAAGARSVTGSVLATPATGTFTTPPVKIISAFPTAAKIRPDSPIAVAFDQDIDPDAIARLLRVEVGKGRARAAFKTIDLEAARKLWAHHPALQVIDEKRLGTHHVIIAPTTAWPAGVEGRIVLAKNAASREGPRVTTRETDIDFDVAPAFTLVGVSCDYRTARLAASGCPIGGSVSVELSNAIDVRTYRAAKIQIDGTPFQDNKPIGSSVALETPGEVGRRYGITVGDGLVDEFAQPFVGPHHATFTTERMRYDPYLDASTGLYVLDPRFTIPQWGVRAQAVSSLHVELYRVTPADYFAYEEFEEGQRATPPGKRVFDKMYSVGSRYSANASVDLSPALTGGTGHVIAIATAGARESDSFEPKASAWIEVTKLAVTTRMDGEKGSLWVQDITGSHLLEPIAGAKASVIVEGQGAVIGPLTTGADGSAAFSLIDPLAKPKSALLVAERGGDSAFVAVSRYEKAQVNHSALWYVTDDRFTYKPGEKVYVKGWVRWTHDGVNPDLSLPAGGDSVAYTLSDARGNKLGSGTAELTDQGGFDLTVELPANANLGTAMFSFSTKTASTRLPISIEEFRAPAYAVTLNDDVTHGGTKPLVVGETIEMAAEAKYYAGGGLGGAGIRWDATLEPAHYTPPGWDRYSFTPVHLRSRRGGYYDGRERVNDGHDSALSGASTSSMVYAITSLAAGQPAVLSVDATVTDVDRMSIRASSRKILVHPSNYYVGVRGKPETSDALEVVVTDIDGNPVAGVPIEVTIEGVLGSEQYRDDAAVADTQHCALASAATPVVCKWHSKDDKLAYTAIAHVADARGRANAAEYAIPWWTYGESKRDFEIIPDRQMYRPGEVAKLVIRSTVVPATAIVSFARGGVISQKRVELATERTPIELPIEAAYIRNVHVVVDRFAARASKMKGKAALPYFSTAELELPVDLEAARLEMTAKATKPVVAPGGQATFEVRVARDDKPVANAEVALVVVDEAILALSDKKHPDPLAPFYRKVNPGTWDSSSIDAVRDAGVELDAQPGFARYNLDDPSGGGFGFGRSGYGAGGGLLGSASMGMTGSSGPVIVRARKDFRATAVFSPRMHTDANGRARITVQMPDSLTRFRVVALATADTRYFGKAESTIITQRAINARTVAPRFLTQGDAFSLPVVVQNLDSAPHTVDVAVRAANLVATGPAGKRVTVPPGTRTEVRFDFATHARGRVAVQTIARSGDFADATTVELPVYEPATTESFATYGIVDDAPKFERLDVPKDVFVEVGGVETDVASTQLQSLTDAYWYVYAYPYECAEQRSSRMLATTAVADILEAFESPGRPTRADLAATRVADIAKLTKDQARDGGWGYFVDMPTDPYVTVQVLAALVADKAKGVVVSRATAYVQKLADGKLASLERAVKTPIRRGRDEEPYDVSLAAAALASLAATGADVDGRVIRLHAAASALGTYPMDAKARVLALLAKKPRAQAIRTKLVGEILSAAHETAAGATVATTYVEAERLLLPSSSKTTALALDALIREAPDQPLIEKLARGLLAARRQGRWLSTQENLAVLQAMRRYFDVYEKDTPNYTGKLWFGSAAYAEQTFAGRSSVHATAKLDWTQLAPGSSHDVTLQKSGPGRMYYRIGITYAPKQTDLPALDAGFVVRRSYESAGDPGDVVHAADGSWKIKLGAKVVVVVETLNTTTRYGVALVDPMPAGLESVNTHLAIAERAAPASNERAWDHVEMRDNRSEAFAMTLGAGTHRFVYTARATTPGKFLAAPTKAEEMYAPETFGRSAGTTVTIE